MGRWPGRSAAPGASAEDHQARALSVRQLVQRMCTDVLDPRVGVDASDWASPAFAATSTATVRFEGAPVATEVGRPGWWTVGPKLDTDLARGALRARQRSRG